MQTYCQFLKWKNILNTVLFWLYCLVKAWSRQISSSRQGRAWCVPRGETYDGQNEEAKWCSCWSEGPLGQICAAVPLSVCPREALAAKVTTIIECDSSSFDSGRCFGRHVSLECTLPFTCLWCNCTKCTSNGTILISLYMLLVWRTKEDSDYLSEM